MNSVAEMKFNIENNHVIKCLWAKSTDLIDCLRHFLQVIGVLMG